MTGNPVYVRCPVLWALAGGDVRSTLDVTFNRSGRIAWRGGNAAGFQIRSMVGEVEVMASSITLDLVWIRATWKRRRNRAVRSSPTKTGPRLPTSFRPALGSDFG